MAYHIDVTVDELGNGHAILTMTSPEGYRRQTEFPSLSEALEEAYKTMGREHYKWRS